MMEKDILNRNGIIMLLGKLDESDSLISHANSLGLAARIVEKVRLEDGDLLALTKIWHPWVDAKRSDYENIESTNEEMLSNHHHMETLSHPNIRIKAEDEVGTNGFQPQNV